MTAVPTGELFMTQRQTSAWSCALLCGVGLLIASQDVSADECDDALRLTGNYVDSYEGIRRLGVDEQRRLVDAICHADDDERISIGRDAENRVRTQVSNEYEKLDRLFNDATKATDKALNSEQCKEKRSQLSDASNRMRDISARIDRMTSAVRAGNNPVFSKLREIGQIAHQEYQSHSGECVAREVTVGNYRADCISSSCDVIEVKPNSSRAISTGRDQARGARDVLNTSESEFAKLKNEYPKLAECGGKFKARVDCYIYCPDIDDNGEMRSASIGWSTCESSQ